MAVVKVIVEFSGGCERLFGNKKRLAVEVPSVEHEPRDIKFLLSFLKKYYLQENEDLFLDGDTIRPGILVMVDEVDWELLGGLNYELQENNTVTFISTLHGG